MNIKKIQKAPFHNANKLQGKAARARYGIFRNGLQVGFVCGTPLWEAYAMDAKTRLIEYPCATLAELRRKLQAVDV